MGGDLIGLVAVTLGMGVPLGALYTYYRVRKLRSEERLAAIERGVSIPQEPELSQAAHSRRSGILLIAGALGYIATFGLIAAVQADRDFWSAAAFGIIPLAIGIGYFLDFTLIRRDLHIELRAFARKFFRLFTRTIPHHNWESRFEQVFPHGVAHQSESYESDCWFHPCLRR